MLLSTTKLSFQLVAFWGSRSTKRFASVPVFCVGKMYEDGGRIKLGLGMQVHHGLVDGYHMGHFVHILERHLEDPTLLEGPFESTFE